jgi:putative peptidoglycan lipid II flippase
MALSLPRTLGSSLSNITFIVIGAMASLLAVGSISIFQLSYNIENTPLLIIGVSYATAAFPAMSRLFTEGNKKELLDVLYRTTRNIFFLAIPVSLMVIVLRAHIVRILLGAGRFSWNDTKLVAASVALFSISVVAQCLILLLVRAFYAVGDTKTPLRINLIGFGVTVVSSIGFLFLYRDVAMFREFMNSLMRIDGTGGGTVIMLPLGFSIGQIINAVILWLSFHKKFKGSRTENHTLGRNIYHMLGAGIIAAASAYGTLLVASKGVDQSHLLGILIQATVAGIVGIGMYGIVLKALGNQDVTIFIAILRSKFWKTKPTVVPQQQDL